MTASAFSAPNVPTMDTALALLATRDDIPARKRRRWTLDSLVACEWFGISPEKLVAHPANLNPRFRRLSRGKLGVSAKRISNVKHSVKCVLACLPSGNARSFKAQLSPDWARLAAVVPDRYQLTSVLCIMRYASAQNIRPVDFGDAANESLLAALIAERLNGDPTITHQNAVRAWNRLARAGGGWPSTLLTSKRRRNDYVLPWSALPPWVEAACLRFVDRNSTSDPFDLSRPMKAWRPQTRKTYLALLRRFLSMLVRAECDLGMTRSLGDIATFEMAERGLRWMLQRSNNSRGYVMAANTAVLLAQIALNPDMKDKLTDREKTANEAVAETLSTLATRLHSEQGLSGKTRDRLVPLKDETNLGKLFLLPFGIEREIAQSRKSGRRVAILLQWAVALMILTFCPLRISTICSISDRHLVWSRPNKRGELSLELEGSMLKNGEQASVPLPKECARLIQIYTDKYRRFLVKGETSYLFPGASTAKSKHPGVMSTQLSRLIYNRLGYEVHPHLYRHIVHLVILKRFPGAYVMISRVLTHKSLETAVRNYAYFDVELSMKAFHQLVRDVQNGTSVQKSSSLTAIAYNPKE